MNRNPDTEKYRIKDGPLASSLLDGDNGAFYIEGTRSKTLTVICSDGLGWDHVSVSLPTRCPYWDEMCFIKDLFFAPDEPVMQLHPAKSEYVNNHTYCLHLWRPNDGREIPTPNSILVGIK